MFMFRVVAVWLVIIFTESVNGTVRRIYLEPVMGDFPARRVGFLIGMLLVFLVTLLFTRLIAAPDLKGPFLVGLIWMLLTAGFELGLGLLLGYSWDRILEDYDPTRGGLMGFGLLYMVFVPWLAATIRESGGRFSRGVTE